MRYLLWLMVFASFSLAAPIPTTAKDAELKKQREKLFADLTGDLLTRTKAFLALCDDRGCAEFLAEKCPPISASKAEIEGWLKDLDSDEEKVWKSAVQKLSYFPAVRHMTWNEQVQLCKMNVGRRRLLTTWVGETYLEEGAVTKNSILINEHEKGASAKYTYSKIVGKKGNEDLEMEHSETFQVPLFKDYECTDWQRAVTVAVILSHHNNVRSKAVLQQLSKGHADAGPSKIAALLLSKPIQKSDFEKDWDSLTGRHRPPESMRSWSKYDGYTVPLIMLRWIDTDRPVAALKKKLRPIKADAKQIKAWFVDLGNEDEKIWKPAMSNLQFYDPRLALKDDEILSTPGNDFAKLRTFEVLFEGDVSGITRPKVASIEINRGLFKLTFSNDNGRPGTSVLCVYRPLKDLAKHCWVQHELAILALERIKTPEAKELLKELATGHPDARPTREATAALERMK